MKKILQNGIILILILLLFISIPITAMQVHRVSPQESLYTIAREYGVRVKQLISLNNLKNPQTIFPGQVLIIPGENVYYVRPGDTLFEIARELEVNMDELIAENNLENPDYLYVDQILQIPERESGYLTTSVKTYEVQPGDSLYQISHQFGISIDTLVLINDIIDPNTIMAGDIFNIPEYTFPELREMYPDHFFMRGNTGEDKVALTFDDGPDEVYTTQILDVLDEYGVPGTFFYMGSSAQAYPEVVERTVDEGHVIANHSWSHPQFTALTDLEVFHEVNDTEIILEQITGLPTSLLRPPYGLMSQKIIEQLRDYNYRIVHWDVDSQDWRDKDVDQILINTIPDINNDSIILFHSAGGDQSFSATVEALPELIYTLEVQDYEFVTVDEILNVPAYKN